MESLIERLRAAGLICIRTDADGDTPVIEAEHRVDDLLVGTYVIFPLEPEAFLRLSESGEAFERFEDEHVGPHYFRLSGDWAWNLYVVYVLGDEAYAGLPDDRKRRVENGKRYGRKLVLPRSRLALALPVARLPERDRGVLLADPQADWRRELREPGLSFCLEPFSGARLEEYVDGGWPAGPVLPDMSVAEPGASGGAAEAYRLAGAGSGAASVRCLRFGSQYRPHCWQPDTALEFARINLLEGSNGAGKTSVLEAIELAFTGKILRDELAGRSGPADPDGAEQWDGRLLLADGERELTLSGMPDAGEQRLRQSYFYRQRTRERVRATQLNRLFHQYNYFSSEAVYRFCYGEQPDYRQAFARVVFGEELSLAEERWKKYAEAFAERLPGLRKRVHEAESELDILQAQLREREERVGLRVRASVPVVRQLLEQASILYLFPLEEEMEDRRELTSWAKGLYAHASELDALARPLREAGQLRLATFGQIREAGKRLEKEADEADGKLAALRETIGKQPRPSELQERLHAEERKAQSLDARLDRLRRLAEEVAELRPLLEDDDSRLDRLRLEEETAEQRRRLGLLEHALREWGALAGHVFAYERMEEVERGWRSAKERTDDVLRRLQGLTGRIREEEEKTDASLQLLAHLHSLGLQYAKEHAGTGICPLCGADHRTAERLVALMETGLKNDETYLRKLREEEQELLRERDRGNAELTRLLEEAERFGRLKPALAYLNGHAAELGLERCPESATAAQIQARLAELSPRADKERARLAALEREAARLDERGFTLARLGRLEPLRAALEAEAPDVASGTAPQLAAALAAVADAVENERRAVAETAERLRLDIRRAAETLLGLEEERRAAESDATEKTAGLQRVSALQAALFALEERIVFLGDETGIAGWLGHLAKLLEETRLLLQALQEGGEPDADAEALSRAKEALAGSRNRLGQCERAIRVLGGLRPLSAYIDEFVETNIAAISDLFVRLHSPQEFERLALRDNELVAFRRSGTGPELEPESERGPGQERGEGGGPGIRRMSTGQRTAVILAIFFVMHLSLETTPNFILLDEPVANMDDLNVLALLDFLRQLTLDRGTQIVFTTANPAVAGLFRRKFSIFEGRFRAFRLSRTDRHGVRVQAETYVPQEEAGVPLAT